MKLKSTLLVSFNYSVRITSNIARKSRGEKLYNTFWGCG